MIPPSARRLARVSLGTFLAAGVASEPSALALAAAAVRVGPGTLELPTDEEAPPDPNPPFDLFLTDRYSYPYTLREELTGRQTLVRHRTLELENEHLKCVVLPDLGGHLYGCTDKSNGAELFYANRSFRKARIGYRGAWSAFGIEFNFPVSHNWVSLSPVDFATRTHPDGSASIFVANVDRVYGMQWRVELRLRPGASRLEQHVALYNPSPLRRRFYWWNNAAVRVRDESRIAYPMRHTASHGFSELDTWPVNAKGVDLSRVGNHLDGPVSLFAHGSREAFMGVYHPWSRTGVVHYSSPEDAPTKKIWSWGGDADGLDWRKALSDDDSAYVEVQAGLFRDQETYGLLGPQGTIHFSEYWMPVRGIGGITRANPEAVAHLARSEARAGRVDVTVGVNVTRDLAGGRLLLATAARVVGDEPLELEAGGALEHRFPDLDAAPAYTVTLLSADGRELLRHTEGLLDVLEASKVATGPQAHHQFAPVGSRSEGDFIDLGLEHEREGRRLQAMASYGDGLERYPDSFGLLAARGRMAVDLQRFAEARPLLERARLRSPSDPQVLHALGLALAAEGDERGARTAFESARSFPAFRSAASLELSRLDARQGRLEAAQARLRGVAAAQPDAVRVGGLEVALLRGLGRADEAMRRLPPWHELDPTSTFLRHEALLLGAQDEGLLVHLAAEPERVLGLAAEYMGLGFWADALAVLERTYPEPPPGSVEPGNLLPQHHPLVGYFRGYCRERTGGSAASDFGAASAMSTRYVFPSRPETFVVLRRALEIDPDDATALLLLGSLHLAGGEVDAAVALWQRARPSARRLPVLHRNLGLTLLHARHDPAAALEVFREGMGADPRNAALYAGADVAASLAGLKAAERVALLERFPDRASLPPALVYKLALALVEVGRAEEAERLFHGRFFPREEGGTNVRQVFLEVRLRRALELAQAGRAKEAAALVASLDRPVKGLTFTQDGLAEFLDTSRLRLLRGDVLSAAGRPQAARAEWERARDGGEGALLRPVHLALAQRRLGEGDPAKEKAALEQALSRAEAVLAQGTSAPGIVVYAQGVTLLALGRDVEAQEALRRVLLLPDVRLSHFLARQALEGKESR